MRLERSWIARSSVIALIVLVGIVTTTPTAQGKVDCEGPCPIQVDASGRTGWTGWSTNWNAAAADGDGFWLAFNGGILRWTPDEGIVERVTAVEGLPHLIVFDIVMDGEGGFWLSGDAGISHRAADRSWTHHAVDWEPSPGNQTMLTGAAGTVWIKDSDGQVHRWTADAEWVSYASARSAVEADFSAALTKQGRSDMWFVSFGEVWVGYEAYDGTEWHTRTPPGLPVSAASTRSATEVGWSQQPAETAYDLVAIRQDGKGYLYAPTAEHPSRWDGSSWQSMAEVSYYASVLGFFVDLGGSIWQLYFLPVSPGTSYHHVVNLMGDGGSKFRPFQINDVISTGDSLWFFSPGIIRHVSSDTTVGTVEYSFTNNRYVSKLRSSAEGGILFSPGWSEAPFQFTRWLTALEDSGTPQFDDDLWNQLTEIAQLEDWETSLDGSIWALSSQGPYIGSTIGPPAQIIGDTTIQYPAAWPIEPPNTQSAFMIADEQTVLIAFDADIVVRLHNNGTPSDFSDDQWDRFDLPDGMSVIDLAQDRIGRIWLINVDGGLYRYDSNGWTLVLQVSGESTLVPAADGSLFVVGKGETITLIHDDGQIDSVDITNLTTEDLERMRTTREANSRWAVGLDGILWLSRYVESEAPELVQHWGEGSQAYPLPPMLVGADLAVDRYDQVWLLQDDTIWRFSPLPDYKLLLLPNAIVAEPGSVVQGTLTISASEGFSETVILDSAAGNLSFSLGSATASVGQVIPFAVPMPESTGAYAGGVTGTAGPLRQTGCIQVFLMENIHSSYLPVIEQ
jgi:hypothetical protein